MDHRERPPRSGKTLLHTTEAQLTNFGIERTMNLAIEQLRNDLKKAANFTQLKNVHDSFRNENREEIASSPYFGIFYRSHIVEFGISSVLTGLAQSYETAKQLGLSTVPRPVELIEKKDGSQVLLSSVDGCESGPPIPWERWRERITKDARAEVARDIRTLVKHGLYAPTLADETVDWHVAPDTARIIVTKVILRSLTQDDIAALPERLAALPPIGRA